MRQWAGFAGLATIEDARTRAYFTKIDQWIRQASVLLGSLGPGQPASGGASGGSIIMADINQVDEDEPVNDSTKGILVFGRGVSDDLAHAINVDADGDVSLDYAFIARAAFSELNHFVTNPSTSWISTVLAARRSEAEGDGTVSVQLRATQVGSVNNFLNGTDPDTFSNSQTERSDYGLVVQDAPRFSVVSATEFNRNYTSTTAQTMTSGWFGSSPTYMGAWRYRKMAVTFRTALTLSPTGNMEIMIQGSANSADFAAPNIIKKWVFDPTEWLGNSSGMVLPLDDILMPFITIRIRADGGVDASNFFTISQMRIVLRS